MNKNKAAVAVWYDDDNPDSFVLIQEAYGIKVLNSLQISDAETEIVVYGPTENVNRFLDDLDEGCVEPFDEIQSGDYDDEDYEAWLNNEVNRYFDLKDLDVFANAECY